MQAVLLLVELSVPSSILPSPNTLHTKNTNLPMHTTGLMVKKILGFLLVLLDNTKKKSLHSGRQGLNYLNFDPFVFLKKQTHTHKGEEGRRDHGKK